MQNPLRRLNDLLLAAVSTYDVLSALEDAAIEFDQFAERLEQVSLKVTAEITARHAKLDNDSPAVPTDEFVARLKDFIEDSLS